MKTKKLLLTAIAFLLFSVATKAQVPNYVPTNGLVGWWPFNGNANDESGNGNNGIITGAVLTTDRNNQVASAYNFDYTHWSWASGGDEIYIPFNPLMNSVNLTVSVWAYRTSGAYPTSGLVIVNRYEYGYSNPNGQAWQITVDASPNCILHTQVLQAAPNNSQASLVNSGPNLNTNVWTNIVLTFDGIAAKQYINSVLVDSVPSNGLTLNTAGNSGISVGVSDQANGHWAPFDGKIDDIGIWNRALTHAEIATIFNSINCALSFSAQPVNQSVNIGNNAKFVVGTSDTSATFQWQSDLGFGFQNLSNAGQYSGASNDTLSISNTTLTNNNQQFRCIITSGLCVDTSDDAILTVSAVGINEISEQNLFAVFPNPATNQINVKTEAGFVGSLYKIYDSMGKTVISGKINEKNTTIELNNLSEGIYLFGIGAYKKQAFKIVKQ
ncbi:MAG: T9SS type A sorting domain-containing protein [Bacteroidetes bacterium]|nr:T9SS type A sorting domain-containing protein [Bacteroidota bacterium]